MFKTTIYSFFTILLILTISNLVIVSNFCNINELQNSYHSCCKMDQQGNENPHDCNSCFITQKEIINIDNNYSFSQKEDIIKSKSEITPDSTLIVWLSNHEHAIFINKSHRNLLAYYQSYLC